LKPYRDVFMRAALAVGSLIVGLQIALYLWGRGTRIFYATSYLGVSLVFTWLVGKAADGKLWKGIEARPLLYTGKISYGLYLWHNFALALVVWYWSNKPGTWVVAPLATLFSYAAAATSWKLLESPLNLLKEKFSGREKTPPIVAALENTAGGI
jgi:peptidoglycan/LPS O-acetylase OafA/YrhL